jgi:hypothetical protein
MHERIDRERGWIEAKAPILFDELRERLEPALVLACAVVVGLVAHRIAFHVLGRIARRTRWAWDEDLLRRLRSPSRLVLPLLAIQLSFPVIPSLAEIEVLEHALTLLTIGAVVWLVLASIQAVSEGIRRRHPLDATGSGAARALHTQINVVSRTLVVFTVLIGLAAALMTFPRVRQVGASLLASAGIAGLAVGLAARPLLENLIAGIQLALTQPIRIGDSVMVDGEVGTIEEIKGTYVVVRLLEGRRLIAPISRFLQQPFQNWTRQNWTRQNWTQAPAPMLGTVTLFAGYGVPFAEIRDELRRIVESSSLWNGDVCRLEVADSRERYVQLRAVVSGADANASRELSALVREKLIEFLQREHPSALPQ